MAYETRDPYRTRHASGVEPPGVGDRRIPRGPTRRTSTLGLIAAVVVIALLAMLVFLLPGTETDPAQVQDQAPAATAPEGSVAAPVSPMTTDGDALAEPSPADPPPTGPASPDAPTD